MGPNNAGADLDVKLELLNSALQVVQVYDPVDKLNVAVDTTLNSGIYYLVVQGAGNANTSNYGSLGSYNISGTFSPLFTTPIKQVLLSGKTDKDKHILDWSIISDEPVSRLSLESSTDGTNFTTLATLAQGSQSYSYTPFVNENIFYRLKAVSITDQAVYSNVIALKLNGNSQKSFTISTMVHSEVTVIAKEDYDYQLADMSGRVIMGGRGKVGINTININANPNGIYLMQIISNNQRTTERIVKL